nr:histidine kinase [Yimella sp. NH-Cas1]
MQVVAAIAGQAGWELLHERKELLLRRQAAREDVAQERQRIARDLHDSIGHRVTMIGLHTGLARHLIGTDPSRSGHALKLVQDTALAAATDMATVLGGLREGSATQPSQSLFSGLDQLQEQARTAGLDLDVSARLTTDIPPTTRQLLNRICQECVTNVLRHSTARQAWIDLRAHPGSGRVRLEFLDRGEPSACVLPSSGMGLTGIRELVSAHAGSCAFGPLDTGPGFCVKVDLPTEGRDENLDPTVPAPFPEAP